MNMKAGRLFLLAFSLLLLSCAVQRTYTDAEGPEYTGDYCKFEPAFAGSIRVVSYNIKLGSRIDQAIGEFRTLPDLRSADIVLLQEMDPVGVETFAESLEYDYVYYPTMVHAKHGKDFGNAVLSKWCIRDRRKIPLPYEDPVRKARRALTVAVLAVGDHEVWVASTHTETAWLSLEKRVAQVDSLVRSVVGQAAYAVIGGDFNTDSNRSVEIMEQIFTRAGFERATTGLGPTVEVDPLGIFRLEMDHIFSRGFEVLETGKVDEAGASDHKPVWAVLKPRPAD
jgi:endonuclease/exonuclease/phosphatase family metal-dependent hydrolase